MTRLVTLLVAGLAWTLQAHSGAHSTFLELAASSDPHGEEAIDAHAEGKHDLDPHAAKEVHNHDPHHDEAHGAHAHAEHVDKHVAEHVEHGTKAHGTGVNGACPGNQSANSVAIGLLASVVLMPAIVYMTMTKAAGGAVSDLTFRLIDLSVSIFLAVLWFSASAEVLETEAMHTLFPYSEEVFAGVQVIILYTVTMCIAYYFRYNKYYLITFCGCAGHYIAFAAIKATGESQHITQNLVRDSNAPFVSFAWVFVVFTILAGMSLVGFFSFRRHHKEEEELNLAVEELELDIVGLVSSWAIMQAVRHLLTGKYPAEAHLFLQQQVGTISYEVSLSDCNADSGPHVQHTAEQRAFMLMLAIGLTIICCVSLNIIEEAKEKSKYWMHKAYHVLQVTLVMCVAWSYLLWGEWQFYETFFHGDQMFGKMVFAIIATSICLLLIIGLAFGTAERSSNAKGYADLCVMAASLVTAFSWEHCFHTAISVVANQYQVGYGGMVPKMIIALIIPLVILPGYMVFLKPIVVEIDERSHREERQSMNAHLNAMMYTGPAASEEPAASEDNTAVTA